MSASPTVGDCADHILECRPSRVSGIRLSDSEFRGAWRLERLCTQEVKRGMIAAVRDVHRSVGCVCGGADRCFHDSEGI